jgi:hypothetical protein
LAKKQDDGGGMIFTQREKFTLIMITIFLLNGLSAANPVLVPGVWKEITPSQVSPVYPVAEGKGLAVDPNNPSTIYYTNDGYNSNGSPGTGTGMYKSTDGGSTWAKIGPFQQPIRIRIDPKNSNHLYAGDGVRGSTNGFWVSNDGGATWTMPAEFNRLADSVRTHDVYDIAVDPSNFNHALVSFHYYWFGGMNAGIFETFDGGTSWKVHSPDAGWSGTGGYDVLFLYNPALGIGDSATWLYCTQGAGYWRTTNAGTTWTKVTTHSMTHGGNQIYYSQSGVLYSGADGCLIRSTNNGITWTDISSTGTRYYQCVAGDGTTMYTMSSGPGTTQQSFITSPESNGTTWTTYSDSRKFAYTVYAMEFDPVNRIMYASMWDGAMWALKIPGSSTETINRAGARSLSQASSSHCPQLLIGKSKIVIAKSFYHSSNSVLFDITGRQLIHANRSLAHQQSR